MTELIRRQDAELILAREMYATSLEGGCDPVSPMDFLPEAKAWMSDAPTIGGWIPCSERLPEKHTRCLVTWKSLFGTLEIDTAKYGRMWLSERKGDGWYIHGYEMDTDITDDVIAWMPLPEPYKEELERSE